jgi:hypothetical protein
MSIKTYYLVPRIAISPFWIWVWFGSHHNSVKITTIKISGKTQRSIIIHLKLVKTSYQIALQKLWFRFIHTVNTIIYFNPRFKNLSSIII